MAQSIKLSTFSLLAVSLALARADQGMNDFVSISTHGDVGDLQSNDVAMSASGRYVAFSSNAANLVANDRNTVSDVFVRDLSLLTTVRVSISSTGAEANGPSGNCSIDASGRFIVFQSAATNLLAGGTNGKQQIFLKDRASRQIELVSCSSSGVQGSGDSYRPTISQDGRFVAFSSKATNLVTGDLNKQDDVFLRDRLLGTTELISIADGVPLKQGSGASMHSYVSGDGRYVAFESLSSNLVSGDTNGFSDVFVRDRVNYRTELVSKSSAGVQGNRAGYLGSLTPDGKFVTFVTESNNIDPLVTTVAGHIYRRDQAEHTTQLVTVNSNGVPADNGSYTPCMSNDGDRIAFISSAKNFDDIPGVGTANVYIRILSASKTELVSASTLGIQSRGDSYKTTISGDGGIVGFISDAPDLNPDSPFLATAYVRVLGDPPWPTISGIFDFDKILGPPPSKVNLELRIPGRTVAFRIQPVAINGDGSYSSKVPPAKLDLSVAVGHWLRKTLTNVDTANGNAVGVDFALINGNAYYDTVIDLRDLNAVLAAFESPNASADLDLNGIVGVTDLTIVFLNFELRGDQ